MCRQKINVPPCTSPPDALLGNRSVIFFPSTNHKTSGSKRSAIWLIPSKQKISRLISAPNPPSASVAAFNMVFMSYATLNCLYTRNSTMKTRDKNPRQHGARTCTAFFGSSEIIPETISPTQSENKARNTNELPVCNVSTDSLKTISM